MHSHLMERQNDTMWCAASGCRLMIVERAMAMLPPLIFACEPTPGSRAPATGHTRRSSRGTRHRFLRSSRRRRRCVGDTVLLFFLTSVAIQGADRCECLHLAAVCASPCVHCASLEVGPRGTSGRSTEATMAHMSVASEKERGRGRERARERERELATRGLGDATRDSGW